MMRGWLLVPIALVAFVIVGLPLAAVTDSGVENDLRASLGLESIDCEATTDSDSEWREGAKLPLELDEPRATTIDGKIYLAGGITGIVQRPGRLLLEPSDRLLRFDPETEEYAELAPMPQPLNHIGVVAYGGDLYVAGGYGETLDENTSRAFYRYDVERDRWSRMPDLPEPRAAMGAGVVGNELILAGGARDGVPRADVFAFDFKTRLWSRLPDMPTPREHTGAIGLDGRLYVFGGRSPKSSAVSIAEDYDVAERRWRRLAPMPVGSGGLIVVAVGGHPVALGGGNDPAETVTPAVQEFAPASRRWTELPSLRTARHGHGAAVADGKIWVFGGSLCAYFNATDDVEWLPLARAVERSR
jgi:non-specific serine/threonine protein kinase